LLRLAHGAVIGFVADSACAWAAASVAGDIVSSEYKLNLLAPAVGETILGRGYVVKDSARQMVCRADVFALKNGTERLVGTVLATIAKTKP
jgi:acyl-coenzyme A thioesterase PaaI-like protein